MKATINIPIEEWYEMLGMIKSMKNEISLIRARLEEEKEKEFLTIKEVCKVLNITDRTYRNYVRSGAINERRIPGKKKIYIKRADLYSAIEEGRL